MGKAPLPWRRFIASLISCGIVLVWTTVPVAADDWFGHPGQVMGSTQVTGTGASVEGTQEPSQSSHQDPHLDPVFTSSGEFILTRQDLFAPGRGLNLDVTFTYRSRKAPNGRFGYGWTMSYHWRLMELNNQNILIIDGTGRKDEYAFNSQTSAYVSPPGLLDSLKQNVDGTFTLTKKHGLRYDFDVDGRLSAITDRQGNRLTLSYDPHGLLPISGTSDFALSQPVGVIAYDYLLTTITDTIGRQVSFFYDANGRLASMSFQERTWTYAYDPSLNGDLLSVTDPSGATTRYIYSSHNLTTITDPKGQIYLTNVYDPASDQLTHQTYGTGSSSVTYTQGNCQSTLGSGNPGYSVSLSPLVLRQGDILTVTWTAPAGSDPGDYIALYPKGYITGTPISWFQTNGATTGIETLVLPQGYANGFYEARYVVAGVSPESPAAFSNTVCAGANQTLSTTTVTDRRGFVTKWTFNPQGNPVKQEVFTASLRQGEPASYVTTWQYNADMLPTLITFPRGNRLLMSYDTKGNLIESHRRPLLGSTAPAIVTAFTYEPEFNLIKTVTDPRGNTTTYTYDYELPLNDPRYGTQGNGVTITYPMVSGATPKSEFTYNTFGQVLSVTDPNGNVTQYAYDATSSYLTQMTRGFGTPEASTISMTHDNFGNVTSITEPNGHTTTYTYDVRNQLVSLVTSHQSLATEYSYDANGNLIQTDRQATTTTPSPRPPTGTVSPTDDWQSTVYTYTILDQLVSITDDLGNVTTYTYDANGNRSALRTPNSALTQYDYDERDLLWKVTDAATPAGVTEHSYDLNGNYSELRTPNSALTQYAYDDFDRLIRTTYTDSSFEEYTYDPASNVLSLRTPNLALITFSYDALDRVTQKTTPEETTTYAYDAGSRLTSTADSDATLTYTYDSLDRVIRVSTQHTANSTEYPVQYGYDKAGNRTTLTYPNGTLFTYEYDPLDRLTSIQHTADSTQIAGFTYDALSRRTSMALPNGVSTSYTYDTANRLLGQQSTVHSPQYTYDAIENRVTMTDSVGTHSYAYDFLSQLTSADYPAGSAFADTTFTYDKLGNRVQVVDGGTTSYTANALNQYTTRSPEPGAPSQLSYDANGNLTSDGTRTFTYDSENRLVSAQSPEPPVLSQLTYDPFGRRLSKTVDGVTIRFLYDGDQVIAETDAAGTISAKYVYGTGIDEPLRMDRGGMTSYYHADGLGSIVALTDSLGAVVERYTYDVYGQPSITDASGNPLTQSLVGNWFLFTGQEYDYETGLYHYVARAYDSRLGRFLQRDPIPSDISLYRYTFNNPVNWIDPDGLTSIAPGNGLFGGGLIGGGSPGPHVIGPIHPNPPTEWQPPTHTSPGPDLLPEQPPAPGTEAGNKIQQGKPVGAQQPKPGMNLAETANEEEEKAKEQGQDEEDEEDTLSNRDKKKDREKKPHQSTEKDKRFIDRIAKELGLNREQRRKLHDAITHQGFTEPEIRAIAQEIKYGHY